MPLRHRSRVLALSSASLAQDLLKTLEPLTVLGDKEEVFKQAGSAAFITAEEIRAVNSSNVNQVLAKVPGVYVREEDGFGNFPNISLRGADGTRSEKVTMMEDGILTAPSPYSAPAAYYSPKVARMAGVEILKGSSQVRYGPQTTGGVINFLSTEIPEERLTYLKSTYGSDNTFFGHAYHGDTVETEAGKFGYLLELHAQTRAMATVTSMELRRIPDSRSVGADAEALVRSRTPRSSSASNSRSATPTSMPTRSYTGLTTAMICATIRTGATRRPSYDQFDRRANGARYLKWIAEPTDALRLESAVYYNEFCAQLGQARPGERRARSTRRSSLPAGLATLNGLSAWRHRSGSPPISATTRPTAGRTRRTSASTPARLAHDLAVGLRLHYDRLDAQQYRTNYTSNGTGGFNFGSRDADGGCGHQ